MNDIDMHLLGELCAIANKRNEIESRRFRAKNKVYYYTNLKEKIAQAKAAFKAPSCAQKWVGQKSKLNKLILQHKANYARARYDAARHTCSTRKRAHRLSTVLNAVMVYASGSGYIDHINIVNKKTVSHTSVSREEMTKYAEQYNANRFLEKVINGKEKTKKEESKAEATNSGDST